MRLTLFSLVSSFVFSIILLFMPLFSIPSYESSIAINIFILLMFVYLYPKLKRIYIIEDYVSISLSVSLILFIIPLIILLISGLFRGLCPGYNGVLFYYIFNAPLLFLLISIGLLFYKIKIKPYLTSICYLVLILLSLFINLFELFTTPKVKFYSLFWGYFPGPIYDEDISIDNLLLVYKAISIIISSFIWLIFYKRNVFKNILAILLIIPFGILIDKVSQLDSSRDKIIKNLGGVYNTEHFEIIYPPDQIWSKYIRTIANLHEYYYEDLKAELNENMDIKIRSYIFRDEDEKKELTGAGRTQIAKPWLKEIYLTPINITDTKLKHEISHIFIGNIIDSPLGLYGKLKGLIPNMAVIEGASVALEIETNIMTLYEKAAVLMKKEKLPSFENLFNVNMFYSTSSAISYSASGSFIKYLIQTYGVENFKRILKGESFINVYQKTISEIESEYREFLKNIKIDPKKEYYSSVLYTSRGLIEKRCPHEIAVLKREMIRYNKKNNSSIAYKIGKDILDYCQSDNELLIEISKSLIDLKRYNEAEKILTEHVPKAENVYYLNLIYDMLSDIYIFKNEVKRGIEIVEEQLQKIPDSDARRNFDLKRYLYSNNRTEFIKKFYSIEKTPNSKAGILLELINTDNEISGKYLFGRLLFNVMDYENSIKYLMAFLDESKNNSKLPKSLIIESANMLLISSIFIEKYEIAENTIKMMESILSDDLDDFSYHINRYRHIQKFYFYQKNGSSTN